MTATSLLPANAPFTKDEIAALDSVVARATPHQRAWLSGFLAGVEAASGNAAQPATAPRVRAKLSIIYASESGNAEGLALKARKLALKQGFDAKVLDMADLDLATLPKLQNVIIYAATWGEGDPPQRAADVFAQLMSDTALALTGLNFAVLGLGDTSYVNFCKTARDIDARLEALGATRAVPRLDLDLDFAKAAAAWTDTTLTALTPSEPQASTVVHVDFKSATHIELDDTEPRYGVDNPLPAEVTELINLNGTGSSSETWHVELATGDDFAYEPGDAIGVIPENDHALVEDLLSVTGLAGNTALAAKLATGYDVTTLSRPLIENYARTTGRSDVAALAEADHFTAFAADRQLIDLFATYPEKLTPEQLTGLLRPLPARLYSVASARESHPGETHLMVGAVRWHSHGRDRKGVASTYLADRVRRGQEVKVYVKPNRHFRLPQDDHRPIIMIGAGTGLAPYRGFIEKRAETGAKGKSWLFFGGRNYLTDFLYQLEWQDHLKSGALTNIDVAFSRDQPEKIYVQHRLEARAAALQSWVDDGAHIYVCGDEKTMARDVDAALARILARGRSEEEGRARLKELAKAGRYQRDVY
jgi:sulfite reductase (NADPH) flavoprotein alpha-component